MINGDSQDIMDLKYSKEKHLAGSERTEKKTNNRSLFNIKESSSRVCAKTAEQNLEFIRIEIENFLKKERTGPTANVIKAIHRVYESCISLRDYEIKKLMTQNKELLMADSNRNLSMCLFVKHL